MAGWWASAANRRLLLLAAPCTQPEPATDTSLNPQAEAMSKHYKTPVLLIEFEGDKAFALQVGGRGEGEAL